jgi:hypothetical protein
MSKKKPKEQTFKQIQNKWYKKLQEDGFEDIEKNEHELKTYSNVLTKSENNRRIAGPINGKEAYYKLATWFVNDYKFKSNLEKVIWEYHSNGLSIRNISRVLQTAKVSSKTKDQIWFIIVRLRKAMFKFYEEQGLFFGVKPPVGPVEH